MQHDAAILASIAAIWFAATVVPGPDFLVTTRIALTRERAVALWAVLGVACGTCLWGLAGFLGIHVLFDVAPWLYVALKLGGGAYLFYLGYKLLLGSFAEQTAHMPALRPLSGASAFRLGLITNLANPKAALFTTSLFAATLPPRPTVTLGLGAAAIMTTIAITWYSALACALTTERVAGAFARLRHWIDRVAGIALMSFGVKLTLER